MSKRLKARLIKYGCCAAFVALIAVLYGMSQNFAEARTVDRYRILCDGFSVPGVLLIMAGALVWASNEGALLGVSYAVRWAVFSLIPGKRLERDERYADYVERKTANKIKGYGFLFIAGAVSLAVGLVFMALFYGTAE